ncbi:squalene/phytoene synthase family protein [Halanaerobium hydrogeniformans]|uniref:Squalene/phytoene synthase n=1 Tax=Halanaerobium hydrogeniformans TaxID=656519 RepID=E4RN67_HALHG|nr:squalene/phytoene synthase family protein [Halanaerobium hydrogeniformans]ADQ14284.1 Squalene/phytoene synthase [Halanaerobium hydrogeniformans]
MRDTPIKFAKNILKDVSRSFALTIPMLDKIIKDEVLVNYLQDRILDNFEDEIQPPDLKLQKRMMDKVSRIFSPEDYDRQEDFKEIKAKSALIKDADLSRLNYNIDIIYQAYQSFDLETQKISHKWLQEMKLGMQKYLTKTVENFTELDEYCYYVAGTVGGFLTELIIYKLDFAAEDKEILLDNFNEAGLFLQKVNLIRDIKDDLENREKHFWPLKELNITEEELLNRENESRVMEALDKMLDDLLKHTAALKKYYHALPQSLSGYKKFFAVNNALGLATVEKLRDNTAVFYGDKAVKVSKLAFANILRAPEKYFLKYCSKYITD